MTQQTAKNAHEFVSQLFTIIFCCLEGISFSRGKYFHHWTTVHKQEGCAGRIGDVGTPTRSHDNTATVTPVKEAKDKVENCGLAPQK